MENIKTRGEIRVIPSGIDELTSVQYEYYCFLAYALSAGMIDSGDFRIRWMSYLLGLKNMDYTILKEEFIEEIESQAGVIDNFIDKKEGDSMTLDFRTPLNLLPEYKGYKGPGGCLTE